MGEKAFSNLDTSMRVAATVLHNFGWTDFCSFALVSRQTLLACHLLIKSATKLDIHDSFVVIGWNNHKRMVSIFFDDECAQYFIGQIGGRLQSVVMKCESLPKGLQRLFDNLEISKSMVKMEIPFCSELQSISCFCGPKTKSISIPSILYIKDSDELALNFLSVSYDTGLNFAQFPWTVKCLCIGTKDIRSSNVKLFLNLVQSDVIIKNENFASIDSLILNGNEMGVFCGVNIDEFYIKMSLFRNLRNITIGMNCYYLPTLPRLKYDINAIEELASTFTWSKISYEFADRLKDIEFLCKQLAGYTKETTELKSDTTRFVFWRKQIVHPTETRLSTMVKIKYPYYFSPPSAI